MEQSGKADLLNMGVSLTESNSTETDGRQNKLFPTLIRI